MLINTFFTLSVFNSVFLEFSFGNSFFMQIEKKKMSLFIL
jgi:hypothetical protein